MHPRWRESSGRRWRFLSGAGSVTGNELLADDGGTPRFIRDVVPILRERRLVRTEYESGARKDAAATAARLRTAEGSWPRIRAGRRELLAGMLSNRQGPRVPGSVRGRGLRPPCVA
jgi:hypothetical protein